MENNSHPIESFDEDKLGFKELSEKISDGIIKFKPTKGAFTIAIQGKWGAGKTSLMNLVKQQIKSKIIVVDFNPWMITSFEQLAEYFFSEISKEIQSKSFEAKLKDDIYKDMKKFAAMLTPDNIRINTGIVNMGYKPKETFFSDKEEGLSTLKNKINNYLKKLPQKMVVIVDDIDRLMDKETETFFRLIKGIADFDNIIYILLYDKPVVARSLEQYKQENGEKYLDKVVQYHLNIPQPMPSSIYKLLSSKLDKILEDNPKHIFEKDRWFEVASIIDKYISNIRDINTVISTFSFEYPFIAENINFNDLFVLSLIRSQKYELYEFIKLNQTLFLGRSGIGQNQGEEVVSELNKKLDENTSYERYKPLLKIIFPILSDLGDYYHSPSHKVKRISDKNYIDYYFTLSIGENKITQSHFSSIVSKLLSNNYDDFEKSILEINEKDKLLFFKDMFVQLELPNLKDNLLILNVIHNLLKVSISFVENNDVLDFNPSEYYYLLSFNILQNSSNMNEVLKRIYFEYQDIKFIPKSKLFIKILNYNKKTTPKLDISEELIDRIKHNLIEYLSSITLDDYLKNKSKYEKQRHTFTTILYEYNYYGIDPTSIYTEIKDRLFNSKENFFSILYIFKKPFISSSYNGDIIDRELLRDIVTIEEVDTYIGSLKKDSLTKKEEELINIWKLDIEQYF